MRRWPGGLIRGTPLIPTQASASGVWTVQEQIQAKAQGIWPLEGAALGVPVSLGSATTAGSISSATMTTVASIPAGSLSVVGIGMPRGSAISVSSMSDGTNSYTLARTSTWDVGTGYVVELWYKENAAAVGSGATITATLSATTNANPCTLVAAYVTGVQLTSALDKVNSTTYAPATAYASGTTGALAQASEIAFGLCSGYTAATAAAVTEGAGFTLIVEKQQGSGAHFFAHLGYQIVSATTALNYQPSLSVTSYGASIIATFKD